MVVQLEAEEECLYGHSLTSGPQEVTVTISEERSVTVTAEAEAAAAEAAMIATVENCIAKDKCWMMRKNRNTAAQVPLIYGAGDRKSFPLAGFALCLRFPPWVHPDAVCVLLDLEGAKYYAARLTDAGVSFVCCSRVRRSHCLENTARTLARCCLVTLWFRRGMLDCSWHFCCSSTDPVFTTV